MRRSFSDLFDVRNGMISPKDNVYINGVMMGPGVGFGGGVSIGGVDLTNLVGKDLDVELSNGVYVIKGYYK